MALMHSSILKNPVDNGKRLLSNRTDCTIFSDRHDGLEKALASIISLIFRDFSLFPILKGPKLSDIVQL